MTAAPAVAPPPGAAVPSPARAASQPSADRFAFAAMLDSLPSGPAKVGDTTTEHQPRAPNESQREKSSGEETAHHSPLSDTALLASLPFALRVVSMMDGRRQAAPNSPSVALAISKAPGPEANGASSAASAKGPGIARLIGERAFHFGSSTAGGIASRSLSIDAPFANAADLLPQAKLNGQGAPMQSLSQAEATLPQPFADVVASTAPARIPARAGSPVTNRVSPARAAAHEAARSGSRREAPAPLPAAKAASSIPEAPPGGSGGDGKAHGGREPDPIASTAQLTAPTDPFGAPQSAAFVAESSFELGASTAGAATPDMAPRRSAAAASPASVAQPVREIEVDLSPGGLEDVSMTMRLAGEKLSVVVRSGSSHTLNSIEGARDVIADRLAAIGQSLDSLIVKQTGFNTDGNTNAKTSSAEDGGTGSNGRSAQGAGERGGSNDALSRRGAGRDRSF